jgi:hypothetical protein
MPSARELLEQADALMQRNRTGVVDTLIDTEIPELTEIVAMVAAPASATASRAVPLAPAAPAAAVPSDLDDVPELTEAVEEIEIESIVELPEDLDESSGWLHHEFGPFGVVGGGPSSVAPSFAKRDHVGLNVERAARSALSVVGKGADEAPAEVPTAPQAATVTATPVANPAEPAPVGPAPAAASPGAVSPGALSPNAVSAPDQPPAAADEWARWEVLADEIRMQVLQRIDIFTDTRLRDQLAAQLQPIVDRASAEMVAAINAHVGGLLRAYIAEAIEREIEKWRETAR